jgi:hypothetical protein
MRKAGSIILALLPLIVCTFIVVPMDACQVVKTTPSATGFLEGWTYRKSHIIQGVNGSGPDYQVRFVVHFEAGNDSGENVFCFRQCKPDFNDIRFTRDDGKSLLSFWMESYTWADVAVFWVKIEDSLDADVTIFMYYGNSNAESASNGLGTFIFFDSFEAGYGSGETEAQMEALGWTVEHGLRERVSIDSAPGGVVGSCLHVIDAVDAGSPDFKIDLSQLNSIAVHLNLYFKEPEDWWRVTFAGGSWAYTYVDFSQGMEFKWCQESDGSGGFKQWTPPFVIQKDTWHDLEFQATNSSFDVVADGIRHVGGVVENIVTDIKSFSSFDFKGCWGDDFYVDQVYVRQFVSNEPSHGPWIVEPDMVPTLGPEAPPAPSGSGSLITAVALCGIGGLALIAAVLTRRRLKLTGHTLTLLHHQNRTRLATNAKTQGPNSN